MKGFMKDRAISCTISALCFIALGVVLVGWPDDSLRWICRLLGIVLLVSGAVFIISYLTKKKASTVLQYDLLIGVILALLGIWLLTNPSIIITFIQYIFGAILIIHGVIDVQGALSLRSFGSSRWWPALLCAIATIALGALIIFNPFASMSALLILIGISLIFDGVSDLVIIFNVGVTAHKVNKAAKQAAEDANVIDGKGEVEK